MSDLQTVGLSDGALKEMEPQHPGGGERDGYKRGGDNRDGYKRDGDRADGDQENKEKGDGDKKSKQAGQELGNPTSATGVRDSSKRAADTAGVDQRGDGRQSSEGIESGTQNAGQLSRKAKRLTPPLHTRPVFRNPRLIGRRHRKDPTSPSSSDEAGSSQNKLRRYVPSFELGSL